jgi:hypothetical protein
MAAVAISESARLGKILAVTASYLELGSEWYGCWASFHFRLRNRAACYHSPHYYYSSSLMTFPETYQSFGKRMGDGLRWAYG